MKEDETKNPSETEDTINEQTEETAELEDAQEAQPAVDDSENANKEKDTLPKEPVTLSPDEFQIFAEAAKKAEENWERYLREKAELDNFRKRSARDQEESRKRANEGLISDLLPILDNFEAAIVATEQSSAKDLEALKVGVEMILGQFKNMLSDNGLKEVNAAGQKFDPKMHDALGEEASDEVEEGFVLKQLRKGYLLRDRLIRPASVYVAKKPEKQEEAPNPEDDEKESS